MRHDVGHAEERRIAAFRRGSKAFWIRIREGGEGVAGFGKEAALLPLVPLLRAKPAADAEGREGWERAPVRRQRQRRVGKVQRGVVDAVLLRGTRWRRGRG